jgi:hypothetical protein
MGRVSVGKGKGNYYDKEERMRKRKTERRPVEQMDLARGFEALGGKSYEDDVKLFAFMQIFHPGRVNTMAGARALRKGK